MIIDFDQNECPSQYKAKICVIGSGPVGLSLVSEFFTDESRDIVVIESGGLGSDDEHDELNTVVNTGDALSGEEGSRARVFGGTSTLWGGQTIPLTPLDFEKRPWVENSGWPIEYGSVEKYFDKASQILNVSDISFDSDIWKKGSGFKSEIAEEKLRLTFSKWSPSPDFSKLYSRELQKSRHITLLVHANVMELELADSAQAVSHVSVRSLSGKMGSVEADIFVLCCGGIENPRILLNSNKAMKHGIGNQHDNVGRYFLDHAGFYGAQLHPGDFRRFVDLFSSYFSGSQIFLPKLQLSDQEQKESKALNVVANVAVEHDEELALALKRLFNEIKMRSFTGDSLKDVFQVMKSPVESFGLLYSYGISRRMHFPKKADYFLVANCEAEPIRESRVTLSSARDGLGAPKAEVHWVLTDQVKDTLRIYYELISQELDRLGIVKSVIKKNLYEPGDEWKSDVFSVKHHIGTTRMSEAPESGVVDAHCKVHGINNLFIAGCSVFPTSGAANPTYTAIALALRLADRIKEIQK